MKYAVLVALALAASPARADDLDTFVADLAAGKPSQRLAGCELLVTPSGEIRQPCSLALGDLVRDAKPTLVVKKHKRQHFPKSQMMWREAEVEVRGEKSVIATFRVVEIETMDGPDGRAGVIAAHWARLTIDKEAIALAKTPPAPTDKITPTTKDDADRRQAIENVQYWLGSNDKFKSFVADAVKRRAIAFGSAPGQRYAGASGAKAIDRWKITLAPAGKIAIGGTGWVLAGATTVVATPADKKSAPITYVLFTAFVSGLTPGGGSFITDPAVISFAVAR